MRKKEQREVLQSHEVWVRCRERVERCEEEARRAQTAAREARRVSEKYLAKMLEKDGHAGRGHLVTDLSFLASKCVRYFLIQRFLHNGVFNVWLIICL